MENNFRIHVIDSLATGNIGTIAAQRAIFKIISEIDGSDLSVSVRKKNRFLKNHPEVKLKQIYDPLRYQVGNNLISNQVLWAIISFINFPLFICGLFLIKIGITIPFKKNVQRRMKDSNILMDLSLESLKGIPVSTSAELIKNKSRILVFHKLFWSYRILNSIIQIFLIKSVFRKPIILGPASFGPFKDLPKLVQIIIRYILDNFTDIILVREIYSARILKELGVKNYVVTTDAVLTVKLNKTTPSADLIPKEKLIIGFSPAFLNKTYTELEIRNYTTAHYKCINYLIDKFDAKIILLPSSTDDIPICREIANKTNSEKNVKLLITDNVDKYEFWIRKLDVLITTRMHPSLIAARNYIPFYSIIYDHKQLGMLNQLKLQEYQTPIRNISFTELRENVNKIIQNKNDIRRNLEKIVPKIQEKSFKILKYHVNSLLNKHKKLP